MGIFMALSLLSARNVASVRSAPSHYTHGGRGHSHWDPTRPAGDQRTITRMLSMPHHSSGGGVMLVPFTWITIELAVWSTSNRKR